MVLRGKAPQSLIESYDYERTMAADENIMNSTRSTDFMVPKSRVAEDFKDAVLELAQSSETIRPFVNSGRLSTPTPYYDSPLSTPDSDAWKGGPKPGFPCIDGSLPATGNGASQPAWLLDQLGDEFVLLCFGDTQQDCGIKTLYLPADSAIAQRYNAQDGATYLILARQCGCCTLERSLRDCND